MQFQSLPLTKHPLVFLRPFEFNDLNEWFNYLSLPLVYEHTSWSVSSPDDLASFVWTAGAATPSSALRLAIAERSTGQLVGSIGFHTVSALNKTAELAYDLSPAVWGKGIATHLCNDLVSWAHCHVGLVRIQATVMDTNSRSTRVLQRCGFVHEGLMQSYRMVRGTPGNFNMYSHILPSVGR